MVRKIAVIWLLLTPLALVIADEEKAAKLAEAKKKVAEAKAAAEAAWVDLKADFDLVRSTRWRRINRPLRLAVAKYLDRLREDPEPIAAEFRGALVSAEIVSSETAIRLADAMIARVRTLERGETMSAEDLLSHAAKTVFPAKTFEDCWDQGFQDLEAVVRYREANKAVADLEKEPVKPDPENGGTPGTPTGMVLVPAGRYPVGPWTGWDFDLKKNKKVKVRINAFFMDVTEVTNEVYLKFLSSLPKDEVAANLALDFTVDPEGKIAMAKGREKFPARGMTFTAARACAKFLGKRLPTEAEWEAAARGSKHRPYPWGKEFEKGRTNSSESGRNMPVPVGAVPGDVTPLGIRDLGGNVSEMTSTLQGGGVADDEPGENAVIVYRGGNYEDDEESVANSYRWTIRAVGEKVDKVGFRCVVSEKDWKKK
jgi:formylglycine-generating enzyme required for sulfatase activity